MSARNRSSRVSATAPFVLLLAVMLSACSVDVGIVATPLSADLINPIYFDRAEQSGIGRVVLLPPDFDSDRGILKPRITGKTRLLLMPDVHALSLPPVEASYQLRLGSGDGSEPGARVIHHTRVEAFRRLGEALVPFLQERVVQSDAEHAETIRVRLFSVRGVEEREAEIEALLDPLRRDFPESLVAVDRYAPGFNIAPVQQRIREIPVGDPILLFLGDPGGELLPLAASTPRVVVGEALFLPPGGTAVEEVGEEGVYLLGLSPPSLFEAVLAGRTGELGAEFRRFDSEALTAGFGR